MHSLCAGMESFVFIGDIHDDSKFVILIFLWVNMYVHIHTHTHVIYIYVDCVRRHRQRENNSSFSQNRVFLSKFRQFKFGGQPTS